MAEKILPYNGTEPDKDTWPPRLREAQHYAIERVLVEPTKAALIGDEPGLGKTAIGVEVMLRGNYSRVLIAGLKDTAGQWAERLAAQSDGAATLRVIDSSKPGKQAQADMLAGKPGHFFVGLQFMVSQDLRYNLAFDKGGKTIWQTNAKTGEVITKPSPLIGPALVPVQEKEREHLGIYKKNKMKVPLDLMIVDEVHVIAANRKGTGRRTLVSMNVTTKVALSGSWFGNSSENAWSVTRWLWPEYVCSRFSEWRDTFIALEDVKGKGGQPLTSDRGNVITKTVGEATPGAFAATLPCYIRRVAAEQAPAPSLVYCDPTPQQSAQLDDLRRDLLTWVVNWAGEEEPLIVDMPPTLHMRMRQCTIAELSFDVDGKVAFAVDAPSAKLGALKGIIDFWGDQPVAIYTDSKIGAHFIAARMQAAGLNAIAWTGDLSSKQRVEVKQAYLAGEFPYIVATIQSFGTGLDGFQKVASKVVWVSEVDGNPALNDQALARFFRPGRTLEHGPFAHAKILMRDSPDTETFEKLIHKTWLMKASMTALVA